MNEAVKMDGGMDLKQEEFLKGLRVLYVEDDVIVRLSLGRFLRRRFKEVAEAGNGKDGLELYKALRPDIVITDIEMPVMNGIEMIERISAIVGKDGPIIIVTTGYDDDKHKSDKACANLLKPMDHDLLMEVIVRCMNDRGRGAPEPQGGR
jgi:YesN/AraC family two-component response regulator